MCVRACVRACVRVCVSVCMYERSGSNCIANITFFLKKHNVSALGLLQSQEGLRPKRCVFKGVFKVAWDRRGL